MGSRNARHVPPTSRGRGAGERAQRVVRRARGGERVRRVACARGVRTAGCVRGQRVRRPACVRRVARGQRARGEPGEQVQRAACVRGRGRAAGRVYARPARAAGCVRREASACSVRTRPVRGYFVFNLYYLNTINHIPFQFIPQLHSLYKPSRSIPTSSLDTTMPHTIMCNRLRWIVQMLKPLQ